MTGLLLADGQPLTLAVVLSLLGLVAIVSSVANYGYALNELYDRDEDRRGGRLNAAELQGTARMWAIIGISAAFALCVSVAAGGMGAVLLTAAELLIPLVYSVPPLRMKNRGWLGVICDASAAHLYPALLALVIVAHQQLRAVPALLIAAGAAWALMTGLRGILSHQLQSEEHDRSAGLLTVVHRVGHSRLAAVVTFVILPAEVAAFAGFIVQCDVGAIFVAFAAMFLCYELLKFIFRAFPVTVFDRRGQRYIPFVDEGAYKVWGPIALALDASVTDLRYLAIVPLYFLLFRPRIVSEWTQIHATAGIARARLGISSAES